MITFPTLYHRGSNGAIYSWSVWTEGSNILTEYGQVNGKKQTSKKKAEAKNVGRSNATTPEEQAVEEARSMWNYKVERKYKESKEQAEKEPILLPMLAKDFAKHKKKVTYPCLIQPKLDGLRCLAMWNQDQTEIKLRSRAGKEFYIPHIQQCLQKALGPNEILDGELYIPGESFQTITSLVKRFQDDTYRLEYHVYDYADLEDPELNNDQRNEIVGEVVFDRIKKKKGKHPIEMVKTEFAAREEEVYHYHNKFVSEGYEGAIVRSPGEPYKFAYRSDGLLKLKDFQDEEYRIVDYTNGKGKFENCAIWVCETENGDTFQVTPKGTFEQREQMYEEAEDYLNCWLKVRFQEKTDDGIPRFPVGIGVRIPEDMS